MHLVSIVFYTERVGLTDSSTTCCLRLFQSFRSTDESGKEDQTFDERPC